ncbi:hypothetical protein K1719_038923 [Acacia pycnantha]|nr:hypothetical protein K1719_038923 [Acacia pycnantha]
MVDSPDNYPEHFDVYDILFVIVKKSCNFDDLTLLNLLTKKKNFVESYIDWFIKTRTVGGITYQEEQAELKGSTAYSKEEEEIRIKKTICRVCINKAKSSIVLVDVVMQKAVSQRKKMAFPASDIDGELNLEANRQVQVDPISSEVAAFKFYWMKEPAEAKLKKEREQKEAMRTLKSAIIIAGIVAAVAGAAFAITKKLKEK